MQFLGKRLAVRPPASAAAHFHLNCTLRPLPSAGASPGEAFHTAEVTAASTAAASSALQVGLELLTACS